MKVDYVDNELTYWKIVTSIPAVSLITSLKFYETVKANNVSS